MRTDHFEHLLTGLSPVVPGPSPVTGDTEKQGGTRLSPVSPVVPGPKQQKDTGDAEPVHPLADLPLLADDWRFLHKRTRYRDNEAELVAGYRQHWIRAAAAEPVEFRQANAGRRAANSWLLDQTTRKRT